MSIWQRLSPRHAAASGLALIAVLAWVAVGCNENGKKAPSGQQSTEEAVVLFANPATSQGVLCPGATRAGLHATVSVKFWAPRSLDRSRVQRHTFGLENALVHLGIRFQVAGGIETIAGDAPFVGAGPEGARLIEEAERGAGSLSRRQREQIVAPLVTAPLRRYLEQINPKTRREVQVFFVDRIADVLSPVAAGLSHPAGLTLSPFSPENDDTDALAALVGRPLAKLPAPIIFLSMYELGRTPMAVRVSTLAHELGHAFGLEHGGGRENLMSPLRHGRCLPGLNSEQVAVLQETLLGPSP